MSELRQYARKVIETEASAVAALSDKLTESFDEAVNAILNCNGRVIVAGMGKSGLIGKKIVATLNSTGIASFFLHPAEAMHGDLGLMCADDILMLISKSGRMGESEMIVAAARRLGLSMILLCGTVESELAKRADIFIDCSVEQEACPNNLVPTSSSTAALVMGDALAIALLRARNFTADDFATFHPGGQIGTRLLKRVKEIHQTDEALPIVPLHATMQEMILEMTSKRLGCVVVVDDERRIVGIFTDGDLRRTAEQHDQLYNLTADQVIVRNSKTIGEDSLIDAALAIMEKHAITQLPTVDSDNKLVGIIHLHDILKSKLV